MLELLLCAWAMWIAANLACMMLIIPGVPSFTGFRVVIPKALHGTLTPEEIAAVTAHEHGHRHHGHAWKNFALVCVFMTASKERRRAQELEADDYAAQRGHAQSLSSALRKLSHFPFDLYRAKRMSVLGRCYRIDDRLDALQTACDKFNP